MHAPCVPTMISAGPLEDEDEVRLPVSCLQIDHDDGSVPKDEGHGCERRANGVRKDSERVDELPPSFAPLALRLFFLSTLLLGEHGSVYVHTRRMHGYARSC